MDRGSALVETLLALSLLAIFGQATAGELCNRYRFLQQNSAREKEVEAALVILQLLSPSRPLPLDGQLRVTVPATADSAAIDIGCSIESTFAAGSLLSCSRKDQPDRSVYNWYQPQP